MKISLKYWATYLCSLLAPLMTLSPVSSESIVLAFFFKLAIRWKNILLVSPFSHWHLARCYHIVSCLLYISKILLWRFCNSPCSVVSSCLISSTFSRFSISLITSLFWCRASPRNLCYHLCKTFLRCLNLVLKIPAASDNQLFLSNFP